MPAMEILHGLATAPAAVFTGVTFSPGNSAQVRSFPAPHKAHLLTAWTYTNAAGILRVRSPRMHDQQQGIRLRSTATNCQPLLPISFGDDQPLESQDTLTVELQGSAVGGQIENAFLLVYYEHLPGVTANLIDVNELRKRALNQVGVEVALNPGAGGGWTGQRAINFTMDTLKAGVQYAILGATMDVNCGAIRIQGSDLGNLGVGIPGDAAAKWITSNWFQLLSVATGAPTIPVIDGSNKGSIFVDCAQLQTATAANVCLILQELS